MEESGLSEAASEKIAPRFVSAHEKQIARGFDPFMEFIEGQLESIASTDFENTPEQKEKRQEERKGWAAEKPKRGRPRVFAFEEHRHAPIDQHHKDLRVGGTKAKTGRGLQEARYAYYAGRTLIEHLNDHPELVEITGIMAKDRGSPAPNLYGCKLPGSRPARVTVLAELGRLMDRFGNGEEAAVAWAVELAKMRPKLSTKQMVAWLRQRRLQMTNLGTAEGLHEAIGNAIDGYLANHPGTPHKTILAALNGWTWVYDDE